MRCLGSDEVKSKCLLAFLREANYVNKVIHAQVESYASR